MTNPITPEGAASARNPLPPAAAAASAGANVTSRSEPCWSATIRAAATPLWSRPRAMSGRGSPIPACRRSRGPLPARFGTAHAFSPPSPPQETTRPRPAAAVNALPLKLNHPHGRAKPRPGSPPCETMCRSSPCVSGQRVRPCRRSFAWRRLLMGTSWNPNAFCYRC
jgi:hypothetical protein